MRKLKTYVVTGGAGFIGSFLCQTLLDLGHRVINIDNFTDNYHYKIKIKNVLESVQYHNDFTFIERELDLSRLQTLVNNDSYQLEVTDIRDTKSLESIFQYKKIDAVIHLAALAGVRPSIKDPLSYIDVNINGTTTILEVMKKNKINKFICASSSSVYGNNIKTPFSEKDIVDYSISPYAATKKSCEIIGHTYHHLYNINTIMLRFFTVYGPRQRPDLAIHTFTKQIASGTPIHFYGDGSTKRDYTYITDTIDGIIKSIQYLESNKSVYEIINLGESHTISLKEMVKLIEENLNKKAIYKYLPLQAGDVTQTYADITKAKRLLKYEPKVNFEKGLKQFIKWYKGEQHD